MNLILGAWIPLLLFLGWGAAPPFYSTDLHGDLEGTLAETIGEAKTSIFLCTYSLSSDKIIQALKKSALRGVPVEVIVDQNASGDAAAKLGEQVETYPIEGKG